MTAEPCASEHPEGIAECVLKTRNHPLCTGRRKDTGEYVDWSNPSYRAPQKGSKTKAAEKLTGLAAKVAKPVRAVDTPEGFAAGVAASQASADARWDDAQKELVDEAIVIVASKHAGGGTFTSDDIWAQLRGTVPVTKGLTARLMAAEREGLIENTHETTIADRGGEHDHGQRLTIWRSLV